MNRKLISTFSLLVVTTLLLALFLDIPTKAIPRIWKVDDNEPADFHTISEALTASTEGDTIQVFSGTYKESITIPKSLTLAGQDPETTVIDGSRAFAAIQITANYVVLRNFTVRNGNIGVLIDGSGNNRIIDNIISENVDGIWVAFAHENTVRGNAIAFNVVGIYIDSSNNTLVSRNTIANNTYGIDLENCKNSVVSENLIDTIKLDGIFIYHSDHGTVSSNTIQNSSLGIHIDTSNGNSIYQNNLIHNVRQAQSENSANTWDNGSRGNYWSDYDGADSNQDGIGDTPYVINTDNQDRYPLMEPFVKPVLPTDINQDGKVNILDIGVVAKSYGTKPEDPRWNPDADIDKNGIVNILDIAMLAKDFGKTA